MDVSIIIPTFERARLLPRLVAALERQTLAPDRFEVIFSDDGSRDDTRAVLAGLAASSPLEIRVVGDGRNRGQAGARNLGWRAAAAPVVAFTDDDCLPTPRWLEAGLAAMGDARRIVVGRVEPNPDQEHLRGAFSRTITVQEVRFFETCNVFYRRADLEAVGGFDEEFTRGGAHGGEDTDLGLRVRTLGAEPVFAEDALVYHDIKPSDFLAALREATRWTGIPRMLAKHPEAARFFRFGRFWRPAHPWILTTLAGAGIAGWGVVTGRPAALAGFGLAVPWIRHRVRIAPLVPGPRRRWLVLPGAFAIDLIEVVTMLRGSWRHRALVL